MNPLQPKLLGIAAAALALLCAAPAGAQQPRAIGDTIAYTLRDSIVRRGAFAHPMELPAACPAPQLWDDLEWQWRRQPTEVLADLWLLSGGEEARALEGMLERESGSAERARRIRDCHDASPAAFWHLVSTASSARPRTLDDCREHVDWQHGRYRGSVREAARWLEGRARGRARAELAPYVALAALMGGQRHNARVMAEYRACWRDDPAALREYVLRKAR